MNKVKTNPFSLTFGREPAEAISRDKQINEIIEGFTSVNPEFQVCMITGVRGSGKTVMMTTISAMMRERKEWIVVELSPERNMIRALAAELSNRKELLQIFRDAKLNLSLLGFGLEIDSEPPITDEVVALDRMLQHLNKRGKHLLVTVDEAVGNSNVREFTSQFQIYMRKEYKVFMLMTGLYEKIYELQNEETLTFLYRAPKFAMEPLNLSLVAQQYRRSLGTPEDESNEMAILTKGYPYAYQVLGFLCYKHECSYKEVITEYDAYLAEYVYDKIWSELSAQDQKVLFALAESPSDKVHDIRAHAGLSSSAFSVYRDRLIKKGLLESVQYGSLRFTLPRFEEYIKTIRERQGR